MKIESGWTIAKVLVSTVIFNIKIYILFSPQLDVSSSVASDMCTKKTLSNQQQQSGKHMHAKYIIIRTY